MNSNNCLPSSPAGRMKKPEVPPKPKGLKEMVRKNAGGEGGGMIIRDERMKKEDGRENPAALFNRANSVRRPRSKPPLPMTMKKNKMKKDDVADEGRKNGPRDEKEDRKNGPRDEDEERKIIVSKDDGCVSATSSSPSVFSSLTMVRKPSARPPPPPADGRRASVAIEMAPTPPSNPPPPPPPSFTPPMPEGRAGGIMNNIYEEIEMMTDDRIPEERKPKFRKRITAGREEPPAYYHRSGGRKGGRERRRTTQLEQWGRRRDEEPKEPEAEETRMRHEAEDDQFFSRTLPPPSCACPCCSSSTLPLPPHPSSSSSSSLLTRSSFHLLDSSATERVHELERRLGRFRNELRQNLAKGMGKLRSRIHHHHPSSSLFTTSSSSSSSPTHFALGKVLLFQDNVRNLNLARRKMMLMKSRRRWRKSEEQEQRSKSTFYLNEEEGMKEEDDEDEDEEEERRRFGDDWSTTSSSEDEDEGEDGRKEKMEETEEVAPNTAAVSSSSSSSSSSTQFLDTSFVAAIAQQKSSPEGVVSLWEEIESEYQKLVVERRRKRKDHSPTHQLQHSTAAMEQSFDTAPPGHGLTPSSSSSFSSSSISHQPLYSSSLLPAAQQPLYQIYMLQEKIGAGGTCEDVVTPAPDDDSARLASLRLETIEETGAGAERTKRKPEERTEMREEAGDSMLCNDPSGGDSASVSSASAVINVRRHSSTASSSADSGRADSLSRVSSTHPPNTPKSGGSGPPMRRERLLGGSIHGSQRSLWCELAEVKEAGLLDRMDGAQKKLQEAYFEVITSEASYLRSLNFLITHFMSAPELLGSKHPRSVISTAERKQLFSNIVAIRDCSERLLCALESRFRDSSLVVESMCDILCTHLEHEFGPYVSYCSNQVYQDRALKALKANNPLFLACVHRLESDRQCQGLDMRSFLMLPMQRVTRYPLLVLAIQDRLAPDEHQHSVATRALTLANQVVSNCNEGARRMERMEQLVDIDARIGYKGTELRRVPLVQSGRHLVKLGQLTQLVERRGGGGVSRPGARARALLQGTLNMQSGGGQGQGTPAAAPLKTRPLALFLFSDLLLIAKPHPKANGAATFTCKDYAARRHVHAAPVEPGDARVPAGTRQALVAAGAGAPHLLHCILQHNARGGRETRLLLQADSESYRERWLSAMREPTCANPAPAPETIYADEWGNCSQALVVHAYAAQQEDELTLGTGDVLRVLRRMPDGWCYGERARDAQQRGWFPASYVQQLAKEADEPRDPQVTRAGSNCRHRTRGIQHRFGSVDSANKRSSMSALSALAAPCSASQHSTEHLLLSRLRRLSNPRGYFGN